MPKFYRILKREVEPIWEKIHGHPFIVEMSKGQLPTSKFKFYLKQDHMFLREFCRFLAMVIVKSRTIEQMKWFSDLLNATLTGEMEMQKKLAKSLGISEQDLSSSEPAPAMKAYTSYLLKVASTGSLGEVLAVMSPCPCSYLELAEKLLSREGLEKQPAFKEWRNFYASEESRKIVKHLINLLDSVAEEASAKEKELMREHFLIASRYEYLFWDMAYKMESWPTWGL